jgi:hypothetical protein
MPTYKHNGLEVKLGNRKIGTDTIIFNMGPAKTCPSLELGLCKVPVGRCYARKAECQYKNTVPAYRERQANYWQWVTKEQFFSNLVELLGKFRVKRDGKLIPLMEAVKYFRFNESGDFYTQKCIEKLSYTTGGLKLAGITTYGYSARADFDFSNVQFLVKSSGYENGNNGSTRVITKRSERVKGEVICPGACSKCDLCKVDNKLNIAFLLH